MRHPSRGIVSRVVRRFSRADTTQLTTLFGFVRSVTRNEATAISGSSGRPHRRIATATATATAAGPRSRCASARTGRRCRRRRRAAPTASARAPAGRRSARRGPARAAPCPRPARCTAPPSRSGRRPATAAWLAPLVPAGAEVDDPRVLAAAALGRVDDERALRQGHPGQAAGRHVRRRPGEDERAQVDVARLDGVAAQRRRRRQLEDRLGDPVARVVLDRRGLPRRAGRRSPGCRSGCRSRRSRWPA